MTRIGLAAAAVALAATATLAQAADGWVTAESHFGSTRTVSGPTRRVGPNRYEVRLPNGTWFDCHLSCKDTLRRETVDFWQNHGGNRNSEVDGPGYFRWEW